MRPKSVEREHQNALGKSAVFSTRITPWLRSTMEEACRKAGLSLSQLINERLTACFEAELEDRIRRLGKPAAWRGFASDGRESSLSFTLADGSIQRFLMAAGDAKAMAEFIVVHLNRPTPDERAHQHEPNA